MLAPTDQDEATLKPKHFTAHLAIRALPTPTDSVQISEHSRPRRVRNVSPPSVPSSRE
jgi:hypothetical protein